MKLLNILFLTALVVFTSCNKEEEEGGTENPGALAEYHFKGDVNGSSVLLEATKDGYSTKTGEQDAGTAKRRYCALSNSSDKKTIEVLMIGDIGSNANADDIRNMFQVGTETYSDNTIEGIVVNWKDDVGKTWTTDTRYGAQSGSTFTIESVGSFIGTSKTFKVTGTMSCKVYDITGDFRMIENATFSLDFDASK